MSRAGKTYFVTGGASGLGRSTVELLFRQGANVVIADKNAEGAAALAAELGDTKRALAIEVNVMDEESVKTAFDRTVAHFGTLNGIINCAGTSAAVLTVNKKGEPHSTKSFDFIQKLNVYGTFFCSAIGAAAMAKLPASEDGSRGVIVNVASVAGIEGQKGQLAYGASKGAVIGMTLPMARDLARYGIRVLTIAPGIMMTPLLMAMPQKVIDGLTRANAYPKRAGTSPEFALLVAQLIDNGFMNGEVIRLDGGIRFANL